VEKRIIIIGAGLSGSLLAVRLAQKGFAIDLFERRPDMRKTVISAGRSINLALSDRGIRGLQLVGLEAEMLRLSIPMRGRMVHVAGQEPVQSPYSGRSGEYINSISRGDLNIALLNKAETFPNIRLYFNTVCEAVNLKEAEAQMLNTETQERFDIQGAVVIGTDGAGSALRKSMLEDRNILFNYSQQYLEHGYKELTIPAGADGLHRLEKNVLHIWPRGSFMLIALPNLGGDFTATLFMAYKGEYGFDAIRTPETLRDFFGTTFPDVLAQMPDLEQDYFSNPTGSLATIKCFPWQAYGKTLLLGDAAHAIVPFYGQGMNCSFEDVVVFDELVEAHGDDWQKILPLFEAARKINTDAIADLAVDNFYEMRDQVADPVFRKKRLLETRLEQNIPDYFSKYSLVTFREDVSYHEAMTLGRKQDELLMQLCRETEDVGTLDLDAVLMSLREQLTN
jgi:kynurenine 3-monooxygenase